MIKKPKGYNKNIKFVVNALKKRQKKIRYDVLSPDGFSIDREKTYANKKECITAFKEWKKRFETQGYYSSNKGRIDLRDLIDYCTVIEVK